MSAPAPPIPFVRIVEKHFRGAALESWERLAGGVSADVFRVDLRPRGGGRRRIVLRVHGASHCGHAAGVEFALLGRLHRAGLPVPEPLAVDETGRLLDASYLLMTFVEGTSRFARGREPQHLEQMAELLARLHAARVDGLPPLPPRLSPLPEVLELLPDGDLWYALRSHLAATEIDDHPGEPALLHGDFWPENLLWEDQDIAAIVDWEDAAIGDPLSDLAGARLELRYLLGAWGAHLFTTAYERHAPVDHQRLALWQVYVAAAAWRHMGSWRLPPEREAHMRRTALAAIGEAGDALVTGASFADAEDRRAAASRRTDGLETG